MARGKTGDGKVWADQVAPDAFAHVGDANWGVGGRYVIDADGRRVPAPAEDVVVPELNQEEINNA